MDVRLYEMRPGVMTPAHKGPHLSELVCSNSLGSASAEHPSGRLKEELKKMGSIIIRCADECSVPAGGSLSVDREKFSRMVERLICEHPKIELIREEVSSLGSIPLPAIIATGPLTSPKMLSELEGITGSGSLYMYDAVAPIIGADSIDFKKVYEASRYGKGTPDYLNCPMDKEEYDRFYDALVSAERAPLSSGEDMRLFEACMPIEEMADRGRDTIRFGPLKPVGLEDPRTGEEPYAVVQLRREDLPGSSYNMVGFQTRLKWPEQRRVFSMIPGLENAEFIRYGVVHRNTYLHSPGLIGADMMFVARSGLFVAGQLSGSEGYVESTATGALAGINAARLASGKDALIFPETTCIGALAAYVSRGKGDRFDPMGICFGLLPVPKGRIRSRKAKRQMQIETARDDFEAFMREAGDLSVG